MIIDRHRDETGTTQHDSLPDDSDPVTQMHLRSTLIDIHDVVREMNAILGASQVAAIAGTRNRTIAYRWATSDGPEPANATQTRLLTAFRICRALAEQVPTRVVRTWFISPNPVLDELTPAEAIASDVLRDALDAARSFVAQHAALTGS